MGCRAPAVLAVFVAVIATVVGAAPAAAAPVAANDSAYDLYGRVFPDPQGCLKGQPGASPWAKGNVCAASFLGWQETLDGLRLLQTRFPRFARLVNLRELKASVPEFKGLDMQSAGLPQTDLSRARKDLYVFVVTDRESSVPVAERKRFAFSLSIHGVERAGIEGGVRAAEELVTWAATAPSTRILEPTNSGPKAGDVLKRSVMYFVLSNPDGWARGDAAQGGFHYQRYNGNGADLNREFPATGFSNPAYSPGAEPEAKAFAAYLQRERALADGKAFAGGLDLHGMLNAQSFSFTLMPGGSRDFATNARVVDVARSIYADATKRLSWSRLIAPPEDCPGDIPVIIPVSPTEGALPMCPDQWGSTWDTINYSTTNSIGDWMGSSAGLGAVGLSNEMAYSHVTPDTVFIPEIEQLHVDGNKGLIYSQLATLTDPRPAPSLDLNAAYAPARRVTRKATTAPASALPAQAPISTTEAVGEGFEFDVRGPSQGVRNGGVTVEATVANVQGVSPQLLLEPIGLERFGTDHAGEPPHWILVGESRGNETTYLVAGARIDVNDPIPGRYRIRPSTTPRALTSLKVTFSPAPAVPQPNLAYDVANTDVFKSMPSLRALTPDQILAKPNLLDAVSAYVLADDAAPGVAAADRSRWFATLKSYVERGGTLVLTDYALDGLVPLGIVPASALVKGSHYAGWLSFTDRDGATTFGKSPLTAGLDLPGASEGSVDGLTVTRQTYDPAAVGHVVSEGSNGSCSDERCDAPQEIVDGAAWTAAGGSVAGRTQVVGALQENVTQVGDLKVWLAPSLESKTGVAYGQIPLGSGRVRIAGGLLPTPTEANEHPYGLEAHGLTWTGYQVLVNLLSGGRPVAVQSGVLPRTGANASFADFALVAIGLALAARLMQRTRRVR